MTSQKRHPYTGNLTPETSGDSKNTVLHCGDVFQGLHLINKMITKNIKI